MDLRSAAEAALKEWDDWQAEIKAIIGGPYEDGGWKLEALRAALAQPDEGRKLAEMVLKCDAQNRRDIPERIVEQARKVKGE
ncbi:MAG: hypothetical protein U1E51_06660 [Candidatus Binatia bacterium]|nr:hypothetical protein [Candidatus Binatia bacterium]